MVRMGVAEDDRINVSDPFMKKKRCNDRFANIKRAFGKTAAVNEHIFSAGELH